MKIRTDFVSNSSSSSFIVIRNTGAYVKTLPWTSTGYDLALPSNEIGADCFCWETRIYDDVGSKINWTANILISMRNVKEEAERLHAEGKEIPEWMSGLKHSGRFDEYLGRFTAFMKNVFGMNVSLRSDIQYSEIDHQSDYEEMPENADMLESDEKLMDFICNTDSHIDNSNDNGGRWDIGV